MTEVHLTTGPLHLLDAVVLPEWVDYNGHMNDACYAIAFSRAIDALMEQIGLGEAGRRESGYTIYTLSMLIRYLNEVKEGAPLKIAGQILEADAKRIRMWLTMTHGTEGTQLATSEQLLLCVDQSGPKAAAFPDGVRQAVEVLTIAHAGLPVPADAGQGIAIKRR